MLLDQKGFPTVSNVSQIHVGRQNLPTSDVIYHASSVLICWSLPESCLSAMGWRVLRLIGLGYPWSLSLARQSQLL